MSSHKLCYPVNALRLEVTPNLFPEKLCEKQVKINVASSFNEHAACLKKVVAFTNR